MKKIFFVLCTLFLLLITWQSNGQNVTVAGATNTTPNLAASYSTLASAITALNGITAISGSVSITLATGYKEMAPAGGYSISFSATATSSDTIIIDGGPTYDTIVANNSLTAGALNDAIFKIIGCDYVTIKRFTMYENTGNTITTLGSNNMTEWGVALLRSSATNGAQHNSILDNTISLDRTYSNTFGIYSNVRHSATVVGTASDITNISGSNYSNVFYSNRVSNVNLGIAIIGSNTDARMDDSNDVGGSSSATGNTITNWGGTSLPTGTFAGNMANQYYGIFMRAQKNGNTSWNTVTSSASLSGSVAAIVRGIHNSTTTGTITGSFSTTIDHNTVTITDNLPTGSSSLSRLDGIICTDKLADGTLSISDNTIVGLAVTGSASGRSIRAISNSASASEVYIDRNTIKGNTTTASASGGWFIAIDQTGTISNVLEINYNLIGDNASTTPAITYSATANGTTIVRGISNDPSSNPTGTASISINGNTLYGFVQANSPTNGHIYINCDHTTTINSDMHIDGNHFVNIDAHVSGDVSFINSAGTMATSAGAQLSVSNNDIVGTFTKSLAGGDVYLYNAGGSSSTGNAMTESGNNFSNITLSGSAIMHGWYNNEGATAAGPEKHITDNVFDTWTCSTSGSATSNVIYCNWASGNSEIAGNLITNISAYADLNGILSATTTATSVDIIGNQIYSAASIIGSLTALNVAGVSQTTNIGNTSIEFSSATGIRVIAINVTAASPSANRINVYYNTAYLHVTPPATATNFSSADLQITGNTTNNINEVYSRNNIWVNTSTPKGSGYTACITNNGVSSLNNYNVVSDNNVYWVGTMTVPIYNSLATANSSHLIYYDNGTANQQSWTNFQNYILLTKGATCESHSIHMMPDLITRFITLPAPGHLVTNILNYSAINCPIFGHGNSQGILPVATYQYDPIDYGHDQRMFNAPYITDIGVDEVNPINTWTGNSSSDWNTDANWSTGISPVNYPANYPANTLPFSVFIPKVTPLRPQPIIPVLPAPQSQVDNIIFQTGLLSTDLPLLTNWGNLKISGTITGDAGSFSNYSGSTVKGSIELNATATCNGSASSIGGLVFVDKKVCDLIVSKDVTISSVSNDGLKVVGELSFGTSISNKTLNTGLSTADNNENLTLVSTTDRTANVKQISNSNKIVGDVTVERYINTGLAAGQHTKKWQALATPTGANSSGQSVKDSWMEGALNSLSTGYGTNIADPRIDWSARGFDEVAANSDYGITTFNTVSQGLDPISYTTDPLYNLGGHFIFVRGDRSKNYLAATPNETNLRSKGELFQPQSGYQPPSVNVPATTSPTNHKFAMIGNPYASAISISYMNSHSGYFNNLTNDVYVWDPLLAGTHGLGGYQTLVEALGYQAEPGTTALYDFHSTSYPEIQSGQAFFMTTNVNSTVGSVHFDEAVKSSNNRLVTRTANISNRTVLKARLFFNQNITDGNVVIFDKSYSNGIDGSDAIKFPNPGENFMIKVGSHLLAAETRQPVSENDSIFYEMKNMEPVSYQIQFVPENFNAIGLQAILIDNYLHTKTPLGLNENSTIEFKADNNKASYEHRFIVVFESNSRLLAKDESIVNNKTNKNAKDGFVIYPNPVSDKVINIRALNQENGMYSIQLRNSSGQLVYNNKIQINSVDAVSSIKIGSIAAGSYDLIITSANGTQSVHQVVIK